jgi:hyperosmotically inducible periplasmic protein
MKSQTELLLAGVLLMGSMTALAQSPAMSPSGDGHTAADNTKSNKMNPSNSVATADDQKDNASDRTLTRRIRQSVMADKSLSTYAHNVKIVAVNGTVTLNGVVRSDDEKAAIESKAKTVAGNDRVVNDLKVTSPKS